MQEMLRTDKAERAQSTRCWAQNLQKGTDAAGAALLKQKSEVDILQRCALGHLLREQCFSWSLELFCCGTESLTYFCRGMCLQACFFTTTTRHGLQRLQHTSVHLLHLLPLPRLPLHSRCCMAVVALTGCSWITVTCTGQDMSVNIVCWLAHPCCIAHVSADGQRGWLWP